MNNLLLVNVVGGVYHDANGINQDGTEKGVGCYPLNWLLHKSKLLLQSDTMAYERKNLAEQARFWTEVPFLKVIGGANTVIPEITNVWEVRYQKFAEVLRGVQVDDSRGPFLPPDLKGANEEVDRSRLF